MADRIVLFGARGYFGSNLKRIFPSAITPAIDIADTEALRDVLARERPDVVINAAGKTGITSVDWCESHREETLHSNVIGPLVLSETCQQAGIYWVHVGTGCVYEGDNGGKGFSESDPPNFAGSYYSRTKAWVDQILSDFPVLVLRPRMPFDGTRHPRNLISKLIHYPRVLDIPNSLTYLPDFLVAARKLIQQRATGLVNVVNPGSLSPYEIMQIYRERVAPEHRFQRLEIEQLPEVAVAGRSNCILNTGKLCAAGIEMTPVRDAVVRALDEIGQRRRTAAFASPAS